MYKLLYNNLVPDILTLLQLGVFAVLGDSKHSKKKKTEKISEQVSKRVKNYN